jgi:pyruvate-formate lyase-activating enzyme
MSSELRISGPPRPGGAREAAATAIAPLRAAIDQQSIPGALYDPIAERPGWVQCYACGHLCRIPPGRDGICRVRSNRDGVLHVPSGYVGALQLDPIEKKPFFHALPGSQALSFGMLGCDYHCSYCFSGETRVITNRGVVRLDSLLPAKRITMPDGGEAGYEPGWEALTSEGTFSPIQQVFRHPYGGQMIEITPYYLPGFLCTPNHRVLATTDPEAPLSWIQAGLLRPGHYLSVPKPATTAASNPVSIDVMDVLAGFTHSYRVPRQLGPTDISFIMTASAAGASSRELRHCRSRVRRGTWEYDRVRGVVDEGESVRSFKEHRPGIPRTLVLDERFAELLGWYCAEGCVVRSRNRPNSHQVAISLGPDEEQQAYHVKELLWRVFGVNASITRQLTTVSVTFSKSSVALLLKAICGARAAEKRVPTALLSSSRGVVDAFLSAFVAGDGHRYPNGKISLTTVSEELAFGIAYLALRQGHLSAIYPAALPETKVIAGRIVRQARAQYTVVWYESAMKRRSWERATHYLVPIRSVAAHDFHGFVYNLEIEGSHTYTANFAAVHNCQNWITSQALRDPSALAPTRRITPAELVAVAEGAGARVIASTYNEPLITSEWAVEVFRAAKGSGLLTAYISNGVTTNSAVFSRPSSRQSAT